jgi:hypothetical protein
MEGLESMMHKAVMENAETAQDQEPYFVDVIQEWAQSIRNAPDETTVHLLIECMIQSAQMIKQTSTSR